jgi:hypothetical protein
MELNFDNLLSSITDAASSAFGEGWESIKDYAPAEFKKISTQLIDIVENVANYEEDESQGYSPETGKILFKMQLTASESVLVAISALTLIAVQNAINRILDVLKNTFVELIPII